MASLTLMLPEAPCWLRRISQIMRTSCEKRIWIMDASLSSLNEIKPRRLSKKKPRKEILMKYRINLDLLKILSRLLSNVKPRHSPSSRSKLIRNSSLWYQPKLPSTKQKTLPCPPCKKRQNLVIKRRARRRNLRAIVNKTIGSNQERSNVSSNGSASLKTQYKMMRLPWRVRNDLSHRRGDRLRRWINPWRTKCCDRVKMSAFANFAAKLRTSWRLRAVSNPQTWGIVLENQTINNEQLKWKQPIYQIQILLALNSNR